MRCDISFLSNPYVKRFSLRLDFRYGFFHILSLSFSFVGILDFDWAAKSLRVYCKIHRLLTLTSQMFIASLMSYSLNVIPMDLFCLSGISCRVIDYGQFSKHPTANTWSISSKMCFVWCFFLLALSLHQTLSMWCVSVSLLPLYFRIQSSKASPDFYPLFSFQPKSHSKYNLIDFVDFA